MSEITGRLAGVTVLVVARPFLHGYICSLLNDAGAVVSPMPDAAAPLDTADLPTIACVEVEALENSPGLMPTLRTHAVPCLILLPARPSDERNAGHVTASMRQPFAGFQVVDALSHLLRSVPNEAEVNAQGIYPQ